jgi:glutaredoxin 3
VVFEDINVMANAESREKLIKLTGQMSIPVIVVDDEVVQGFNKPKLKSLLGL